MKTRALLITLFVAIAIPKVYAQYDEFFKDKYRSDTLYMENYTYVCDTVAGTVELRNILNSNDKGLMVYADTGKIPFDDIWGHEWPDHYLSPISLQQKLVDIVDEAFTPEQSAIVKGHNFGRPSAEQHRRRCRSLAAYQARHRYGSAPRHRPSAHQGRQGQG